jgi:hypothetical protein
VIVNFASGRASQRWQFNPENGSLKSEDSPLIIDLGSREVPHRGSEIMVWSPRQAENQRWVYDSDTKAIASPQCGLALDISGARFRPGTAVIAWEPNGLQQQQWLICRPDGTPVLSPFVIGQAARDTPPLSMPIGLPIGMILMRTIRAIQLISRDSGEQEQRIASLGDFLFGRGLDN